MSLLYQIIIIVLCCIVILRFKRTHIYLSIYKGLHCVYTEGPVKIRRSKIVNFQISLCYTGIYTHAKTEMTASDIILIYVYI